jgi:hypothetical protein
MLPLSYIHGKKLTPVRIMNSASSNSKNIANSVGIFTDSDAISNILRE